MKFWTFQNIGTLLEIHKKGVYKPDFNSDWYKNNCYRLNSYNYILDLYNNKFNEKNTGLVFGMNEYMGNKINTYDDYINVLGMMCSNGISSSIKETYVLELDIPLEEERIMPIDFYLFADLIYFMDIEPEEGNQINRYYKKTELEVSKNNLFKMNTNKGVYELKQVHFPYIDKCHITNIYKGVEVVNGEPIYSECEYLDYFRKVLISR